MLSSMRKNAGSLIIKILFGVIIIVFVLWGVGTDRSQQANQVAVVNGEAITLEEYSRVYDNLLEQMRSRFGGQLDEETIRMLNIRQQAVNQLIDERVMLHEAREMGILVSDEELTESIRRFPAFQVNGVFDTRQYNRVLSSSRLTAEVFETAQRRAIVVDKLRRFVSQGAMVSEAEAREWFDWQNAAVNVDYVLFSPDDVAEPAVTDDEIAAFFDKDPEAYKTEPQVKARYLVFRHEAFRPEITVSEEEVREYYDENTDEFEKPETVEARHILLKVAEDADEETVEAVRKNADAIYQEAVGGADFAELAKTHSEGPTRETGGALGAFQRGSMVKPFEDKAFSLEAGEISEPVRTSFGWHIIKVEKKTPEVTLSLEESENRIRGQLTDRKARVAAYDRAQEAYDATYDGEDLTAIGQSMDVEVSETEFFTRRGPAGLNDAARFAATAFELGEAGDISDVAELRDGYYLIEILERKPAEVPPLEDVRDRVAADLKAQKKKDSAAEAAGQLLEAVRSDQAFEAAAAAAGKTPAETGLFKRTDTITGVGREPAFSEAAFGLSEKEPYPEAAVAGTNGYYVLRFKERKLPEAAAFEEEKETVRSQLLSRKQFEAYQSWLETARERSEIAIETAYLE